MKRIRAATRAARANTPASSSKKRRPSTGKALQRDDYKEMVLSKSGGHDNESDSSSDDEDNQDSAAAKNVLVLTCFAPVGSPLIGASYRIDKHGATLGRKPSNTVALCAVSKRKKNPARDEFGCSLTCWCDLMC